MEGKRESMNWFNVLLAASGMTGRSLHHAPPTVSSVSAPPPSFILPSNTWRHLMALTSMGYLERWDLTIIASSRWSTTSGDKYVEDTYYTIINGKRKLNATHSSKSPSVSSLIQCSCWHETILFLRRTRASCWNVRKIGFLPSEVVRKRTFYCLMSTAATEQYSCWKDSFLGSCRIPLQSWERLQLLCREGSKFSCTGADPRGS